MLEIKDLCVSYGAIDAVKGISLKVNDGEIVSLIGANGAGKTTTLHTITGLVPAKSGSITYDGHDLLKTHANKIVTLGMAHVPEGRHVFTRMSVQENLEMGAFSLKDQSSLGKDLEMVFDYFPRLKERRRQLAGTLSGGEQQMLAMGRALMSHPKRPARSPWRARPPTCCTTRRCARRTSARDVSHYYAPAGGSYLTK